MWVEKSKQVPSHLWCARVLNKRSAAQKANSNTVVSGRVLNKAKKQRSEHIYIHTHTYIYIYIQIIQMIYTDEKSTKSKSRH